jgi:RimJ/RimL family protein N-acetyltransferase
MSEALELRSPRLCLRRLRPEDATALTSYRSLPEVARFQSWESFELADAVALIGAQAAVAPDTPGTWLQLALVAVESGGGVVGDCGLHFRADDPRQVEVGITLAPAHQGRGLATEALARVLDYLFGGLGKHRVSAVTDAENHAAAGLLRRVGFRREAHHVEHVWFKGAWGSEYVFAVLRREWQAARTARRPHPHEQDSDSGRAR